MSKLDIEIFSTDEQKKIVGDMSTAERAEIKPWPNYLTSKGIHRFPNYLSIEDIGNLLFPIPAWTLKPDDKNLLTEWKTNRKKQIKCNHAFKDQLIDACTKDKLSYEGDIAGWSHYNDNNPHPLAKKRNSFIWIPGDNETLPRKHEYYPKDCTIQKDELKRYYESIDKWTLINKGLLARWWVDNPGKKSKALGDADQNKINRLRLFVAHVWMAKDNKGKPKLPLQIPCKKETIYFALRDWENKIIKNNEAARKKCFNITFSTFDGFWKLPEAKEICRGISPGEQEDELFFKNINYDKFL